MPIDLGVDGINQSAEYLVFTRQVPGTRDEDLGNLEEAYIIFPDTLTAGQDG